MRSSFFRRLFVFLIMVPFLAKAQDGADSKNFFIKKADTSVLSQIRLDFAVPDMPAFKALGKDPSNLLRPSSAKDIALMFGNFRSNGSFIIPKNFAVEVAPGLFKPWYTLHKYATNSWTRFLTKLRISLGSDMEGGSDSSSIAIGIRMTLLDKSDFRKDTAFLNNNIYKFQDAFTGVWKRKRDSILIRRNITIAQFADMTDADKAQINDQARQEAQTAIGFDLDAIVDKALKDYKKNNWNASKIDFAYSLLAQSPDSLFGNAKVTKHMFWFAWAIKPGKNNHWGQLLFGVTNSVVRADSKFYNEFNGNFRFYAGANRVKGFLEFQYQNLDNRVKRMETLYSQIGLEVAVYKSIWLHFGTGVLNALNGTAKSQLLSNLNLYFSFPENLKLF